ncbi:6127_t:CDS:10, partial [Scutellospora calospora]
KVLRMVKVKTQGRDAFRSTSLDCSDDDKLLSIPAVIEDEEDDDLLSSTELELAFSEKLSNRLFERSESSQSDEPILRRSTRPRKQVSFQQMVPTAEAVPLRGEIPYVSRSASTTSNSYQFSLSSLLREKKHRDKAGYDIRRMESALSEDSFYEIDDQFDIYDRTEVSASVLNEDIKREHLQQIFKEDENVDLDQQVEFFCNNNYTTSMNAVEDPAFALIAGSSSDDETLKYILCQDWIPQQYELGMKLPSETISWLLELISYEEDSIIIEAASHTLKPAFGASSRMLGYECLLEEHTKSLTSLEPSTKFPYIYNLQVLLKTIAPLVENRLLSFSNNEEIRRAICVVLRISLDRRMSSISTYIEKTVDSFLYLFPEDDWSFQNIASACGTVTKFNAVTLENLPVSIRGRLLRRLLAFKSLFTSSSKTWNLDKIDISKPLSLEPLLTSLDDEESIFKLNINTNYNELYYKVLLLNFAIDDEKQMISEKNVIEDIIQRLKHLHGKIVDMRAAFMDRTKAKDLIHRVYMRLYYVTSYRRGKTQTSILKYSPKKIQQGTLDMFIDQKC